MPRFFYKAVNSSGEVIEGYLEAPDQATVIETLHAQGHTPIRAEDTAQAGHRASLRLGRRRALLSGRALVDLTTQLAVLLRAGLDLDRALSVLIDVAESDVQRALVSRVRDRIHGGGSLSEALAAEGDAFPRLYVNMVRAGETAGALDVVLQRLADYTERSLALKESVKSALIYPAVLVAVSALSIIVLITFVLPRFAVIFEDMGAALPWSTQLVMSAGELARDYGWLIVLLALLAWAAARHVLARPAARRRWHASLLGVPLLGPLLTNIETARFSRTLGTLLGNGVPMLTALAGVKQTLSNMVIVEAMDRVEESLKHGKGLAAPLAEVGCFPRQAVHMIRVGEETGRLEDMLERIAGVYDREVQTRIARLLTLVEPALILGLGAVVAMIVLSLLMAIMGLNELPL